MRLYSLVLKFALATQDVAQADFLSAVRSADSALVLFHAQHCGHSRQFSPDFSYAGDLVEEATQGKTRAFRVDVGQNATFAEEFDIRGFPSVKFFAGGDVANAVDFDGVSATPVALKTWTLKQLNVLTELKTRDDALQLLKRASFAVVTFFVKPEHDYYFSEFAHLSRTTPDMEFAFTCSREIANLLNVPSEGGFVVYHPHDAGFSMYQGGMDKLDAMELFIRRHRLPLVAKLDHANPEIVVNDGRVILLLLVPETAGNTEEFGNFARLHQSRREEILFLVAGRKEPVEARLLEYIGDFSDTDQPHFWIIENFRSAGDMRKFRCTSLATCLDDYDAGRLVRFVKSAPPTLSHADVVDFQGTEFQALLEKSSMEQPLLIFFLAPWCSACSRFNELYESAEFVELAKSLNVTLSRIDVAGNDTPGLSVLTYPALRLVRGVGQVASFTGDYTKDVKSWLNSFFDM
jgi:protein disulfide-isomerase A1